MPDYSEIHNRIDRMELKIDKLVDAMTELVKLQPTINSINMRLQGHAEQIDKLDERVDKIDQVMPLIKRFMSRADKISLTVTIVIIVSIVGTVYTLT